MSTHTQKKNTHTITHDSRTLRKLQVFRMVLLTATGIERFACNVQTEIQTRKWTHHRACKKMALQGATSVYFVFRHTSSELSMKAAWSMVGVFARRDVNISSTTIRADFRPLS